MRPCLRVVWILAGILLLVGSIVWIQFVVQAARNYSGDGVLKDYGLRAYPRYRIAFEPVSTGSSSNAVLTFRHVPSRRMTFAFEVNARENPGVPKSSLESLVQNNAKLTVRIEAEGSEQVVKTTAHFKDWVQSRSTSRNLLWHPSLRDLRLDPQRSYRVMIEFGQDSTSSNSLTLRPVLEGGGIEWP